MTIQPGRRVSTKDAGLLVVAAAIYGGIFPVNRMAAEAGFPPLSFALLQSLLAAIALLAWNAVRRRSFPLSRAHVIAYLVIGGLVTGLPIGLLVKAAEHIDASILTLVLCLSPILTLAIASATGIERFDRRVLFGMLFGAAGVAVIAWPDSGVISAPDIGWFLLALLAPVMFATANNCAAWLRPPAAPALAMAAGTLLGAAVVALVVTLALGSPLLPLALSSPIIWPLALASAINVVFFWLFFELVARIGPAKFSVFNYLAVVAGLVWSMLWFGESPAPIFWVACGLMLIGMHLALRPGSANSG